jgi:hypothetical protein
LCTALWSSIFAAQRSFEFAQAENKSNKYEETQTFLKTLLMFTDVFGVVVERLSHIT